MSTSNQLPELADTIFEAMVSRFFALLGQSIAHCNRGLKSPVVQSVPDLCKVIETIVIGYEETTLAPMFRDFFSLDRASRSDLVRIPEWIHASRRGDLFDGISDKLELSGKVPQSSGGSEFRCWIGNTKLYPSFMASHLDLADFLLRDDWFRRELSGKIYALEGRKINSIVAGPSNRSCFVIVPLSSKSSELDTLKFIVETSNDERSIGVNVGQVHKSHNFGCSSELGSPATCYLYLMPRANETSVWDSHDYSRVLATMLLKYESILQKSVCSEHGDTLLTTVKLVCPTNAPHQLNDMEFWSENFLTASWGAESLVTGTHYGMVHLAENLISVPADQTNRSVLIKGDILIGARKDFLHGDEPELVSYSRLSGSSEFHDDPRALVDSVAEILAVPSNQNTVITEEDAGKVLSYALAKNSGWMWTVLLSHIMASSSRDWAAVLVTSILLREPFHLAHTANEAQVLQHIAARIDDVDISLPSGPLLWIKDTCLHFGSELSDEIDRWIATVEAPDFAPLLSRIIFQVVTEEELAYLRGQIPANLWLRHFLNLHLRLHLERLRAFASSARFDSECLQEITQHFEERETNEYEIKP